MSRPEDHEARFSRRRLLAWAGGLGLAALVPGCGDGADGGDEAAPAGAGPTTSGATAPDCVLTPELTEGPFYLDLDLVRRDITEDREGTPLDLVVTVLDADSCEPISDAAVDVWHCDAGGAYSGVEGGSGTFLRGIQVTDASGAAEFRTIYPGWYSGRAVHIHLKVHLGADEAHTGQLFFDEDITQAVYEAPPYNARPGPDVPNEADGIFGESGGTTIVAVMPGEPYRGEVRLGVRRA
jgi:Dioxygenase